MDPALLSAIAEALGRTGPWGLLVVLGWAYWRKERECKELRERLAELAGKHIELGCQMKETVDGLRESIAYAFLRRMASKPPSKPPARISDPK